MLFGRSHFKSKSLLSFTPLGSLALGLSVVLVGVVGIRQLAAEPTSNAITIRPLDLEEAKTISYSKQIHPMLVEKCGDCHAGAKASSGLDVTSFNALMKGGKHGPALIVGKPDESSLVAYVRGLKKPRMPMGDDPLTVDQVHLLREWIAAGAHNDTDTQKLNAAGYVPLDAHPQDTRPVEDESGLTLQQIRAKHIARLPAPPRVPKVKAPVFNPIDAFIAAQWAAHKMTVPTLCDDATFVRRVYLDVIGTIPTVAEAQAFIADKTPAKRAKLIDRLLARDDDYTANWMPWWEEALTSNGKHQGGVGTRPDLGPWLTENLKKNRPYDEMVAELIDPNFAAPSGKKVTSWIRNENHVDTIQTAANVAQVFEGTALKCASCHNHFLNKEWPQKKFLSFASYFSPTDVEVIRCEVHEGEFMKPSFIFNQPAARQPVPKDLNGRLKLVARLIVDPENPRFAASIVNRLWKRYLGLGLVEPADDFRADRKATNPELMAWLADDFMRHKYDLKHTISLILNSRTYQLRYNPKLADTFNVGKPDLPRYYRSPALRRLTAEQLLDSINVAIGNPAPRLYLNDASTALTRALGKPATRNDVSTNRPDDVAVVQALELLNGEEFNNRVGAGKLATDLSQEKDLNKVVTTAYWSLLSRPPTPAELGAGVQFLTQGMAQNTAPNQSWAQVWIEDQPPTGARVQGNWEWVENPVKVGKKSHTEPVATGARQHYFADTPQRLKVQPGDTLFAWVYLDPATMPREIMLQWNTGDWDHRAYWGENLIPFGTDGDETRIRLGDLPAAGQWVRLEIPAAKVGLAGKEINGLSFDIYDGRVYWDAAGVIHNNLQPQEAVVDMLWALMAHPEFQYIK